MEAPLATFSVTRRILTLAITSCSYTSIGTLTPTQTPLFPRCQLDSDARGRRGEMKVLSTIKKRDVVYHEGDGGRNPG